VTTAAKRGQVRDNDMNIMNSVKLYELLSRVRDNDMNIVNSVKSYELL